MKRIFELKMDKNNRDLIEEVTAKNYTIDGFLQRLLREYKKLRDEKDEQETPEICD